MAGKGDRVPRPIGATGWSFRFRDKAAADGWDDLSAQLQNATATAWDHITGDPRSGNRPTRQHQLKGDLGSIEVKGAPSSSSSSGPSSAGR